MAPFYDGYANKKGARKIGETIMYYLQADEGSMRTRYSKIQPGFRFTTFEYMYAMSSIDIDVPDKPRRHFPGTTRGDALGPIKYEMFDTLVQISFEEKKKAFGSNIRRVGGPGPAGASTDEATDPRKPSTAEPMFFHHHPTEAIDEY